jgi:two-component system, chemotaxis family, protein-glutamate methylesterase/glutaminase
MTMEQHRRDIIVVGASMGGVEGFKSLAGQLPISFSGTLFLVLHTSPESPGILAEILSRAGPLPATNARHGAHFRTGHLYVAPPDHHLHLRDHKTILSRGPKENRTRPAIDPLFRSAAATWTTRVVGVLLSGYLDDGVAGLSAIQRCGGLTVVQDPNDTLYPDMPRNALNTLAIDHCLPLAQIGALLHRLSREAAPPPSLVPDDLRLEVSISENLMSDISAYKQIGAPAALSCPDCGGPLWQLENDALTRFRCHVGHAFTAANLLEGQGQEVERALWIALRTLEERARMLHQMADDASRRGDTHGRYDTDAKESLAHAEQIRGLLMNLNKVGETP